MLVDKGHVPFPASQSMSIPSGVVLLLGWGAATCPLKSAERLFTSLCARCSSLRTICAATRPESSSSTHKLPVENCDNDDDDDDVDDEGDTICLL